VLIGVSMENDMSTKASTVSSVSSPSLEEKKETEASQTGESEGRVYTTPSKGLKGKLSAIWEQIGKINLKEITKKISPSEEQVSSLTGRAKNLKGELQSKIPKPLQDIAKKFAKVVARGVESTENKIDMLTTSLPFKKTLEEKEAKALETLKNPKASASEKQKALSRIEISLKESIDKTDEIMTASSRRKSTVSFKGSLHYCRRIQKSRHFQEYQRAILSKGGRGLQKLLAKAIISFNNRTKIRFDRI
jgi:hypothetical protein